MYGVVLLATITAGEAVPHHGHHCKPTYGACHGACYGYAGAQAWCGPVHAPGCWGMPYGGYWAGYDCWGACGGYSSAAYGMHPPTLTTPGMDRRADDKDSSTNKKDADNSNKGKDADNSDKDKGKDKDKDKGKDDDADKEKTRARLIFELPQGAKLFVDDQPIANADTRRSFRTPALEQGEQYYYEFRVEYLREGKAQVEKKRVTVSAGDVIKADFTRSGGSTDIVTVEPRR